MASIALPPAFPVVGIAVVSTFALNMYQVMLVMRLRKEAGVKYPTLYASDADVASDPKKKIYNCAQRAHANTLENIPSLLSLFAFTSIFHPVFATGAMMTWIIGRVGYTRGYATGDPNARLGGFARIQYLGLLGLLVDALYVTGTKVYAHYF